MILVKTYKKIIPSFRHKKTIKIFDNSFYLHKKKLKSIYKKNFIKKNKQIYNHKKFNNFYINLNLKFSKLMVVKQFTYNYKPYKKYLICLDNYNNYFILPGIENLNIGKIIFNYKYFNVLKSFFFKGLFIPLYLLPVIAEFCNIVQNGRIMFSKSSGTSSFFKYKIKNKKKLLFISLPSNNEIYVSKNTWVFLGKNTNFTINSLNEGKFGYSFAKKKKINVRGVAMNPVDHPNGGRTKTVQPERSPWAWVAKKKK